MRNFEKLLAYANKYQISIQFWGDEKTNVYIEKDDVDFGGLTPFEAIDKTVEYLDKINNVKP